MAIQSIASQMQTQTQTAAQKSTASLGNNYSTFLTLLTKQLQYQDPLQPMDTAQFTNQLVLYTQAEQQIKTNSSLDNLVNLYRGTVGTQALTYIGKDVGYVGNTLTTTATAKDQKIIYSLASGAAKFDIAVTDKTGKTVRSLQGDGTAGDHTITWDGKDDSGAVVPAGDYTIKITALDQNDKAIDLTTIVSSRVAGLQSDGNGSVNLVMQGGSVVSLGNIYSVFQPATTTSTTTQQSS